MLNGTPLRAENALFEVRAIHTPVASLRRYHQIATLKTSIGRLAVTSASLLRHRNTRETAVLSGIAAYMGASSQIANDLSDHHGIRGFRSPERNERRPMVEQHRRVSILDVVDLDDHEDAQPLESAGTYSVPQMPPLRQMVRRLRLGTPEFAAACHAAYVQAARAMLPKLDTPAPLLDEYMSLQTVWTLPNDQLSM